MIDHTPEGSAHVQEIPFPAGIISGAATPKYIPCGNNLLLDYQKPANVGGIIMPQKAKQLETIVTRVTAIGPDVKDKTLVGKRVVILAKALIGGEEGLMVDGRRVYLSQEQVLIAV